MAQVRVPFINLLPLMQQLVTESITWESVMSRFVVVKTASDAAAEAADVEDGAATTTAAVSPVVSTTAATVVENNTRGSFSRPNPLATTTATASK